MQVPQGASSPRRLPSSNPGGFQFGLRSLLFVMLACCLLFAFRNTPWTTTTKVAWLTTLVAAAAIPVSRVKGGILWLLGGTVAGLATGMIYGAALLRGAYGPWDKEVAWKCFTDWSYFGTFAGALAGFALAWVGKSAALYGLLGMTLPVLGWFFNLVSAMQTPSFLHQMHGAFSWFVPLVVFTGSLGVLVGSWLDRCLTEFRLTLIIVLNLGVLFYCSFLELWCPLW